MGMRRIKHHSLFFFLALVLSSAIAQSDDCVCTMQDDCVYTVYVRTGSTYKAGTNSIISLTLYNEYGDYLEISNLETWGGLMEDGHDYFERGNLDIFSGRGRCLGAPVCAMNLTSDGSGSDPGWYCNYVEVTSSGPHISCAKQLFLLGQWIDTEEPPYEPTVTKNYCLYDPMNPRKLQQQIPSELTVM